MRRRMPPRLPEFSSLLQLWIFKHLSYNLLRLSDHLVDDGGFYKGLIGNTASLSRMDWRALRVMGIDPVGRLLLSLSVGWVKGLGGAVGSGWVVGGGSVRAHILIVSMGQAGGVMVASCSLRAICIGVRVVEWIGGGIRDSSLSSSAVYVAAAWTCILLSVVWNCDSVMTVVVDVRVVLATGDAIVGILL